MKKILFILLGLLSINTLAEKGYKSEAIRVFGDESTYYRIPSIAINKEGKLILSADKRYTDNSDWNNIDTVIKFSDDGVNFSNEKILIDLADEEQYATGVKEKSAFTIDSVLLNTKKDELFMLVDMFPKSKGIFTVKEAEAGTGYLNINGENYLKLNKFDDNNLQYLVAKDGKVYSKSKTNQDENISLVDNLTVVMKDEAPFRKLGDIYLNEERIGNIYRGKSAANETGSQFDGEYLITPTSYLWLTKSKDGGKTWESPIDLNTMLKKDYISFLGTGPSRGLELQKGKHKGRLIFPVYYTTNKPRNNGKRDDLATQQSALIYSDDNGKTWKLGESVMEDRKINANLILKDTTPALGGFQLTESQVVELNNGTLKLFMRGYNSSRVQNGGAIHLATSFDGGATWENTTQELPFAASYSQVSAIHYGNVGDEEFVLVAAPSDRSNRINGKFHLGRVKGNDIEWVAERIYSPGSTAYSSIVKLPNGDIATLYEVNGAKAIDFTILSLDWIAPNYKFKDFLEYQKQETVRRYAEKTFESMSKLNSTLSLNEITDNKATLRYNAGMFNKNLLNVVEFSTPITKFENKVIKNLALYGMIGVEDKNIFSNVSLVTKFNEPKNIIQAYQTLGLEFSQNSDVFNSRGYDIKFKSNYIGINSNTNLTLNAFNKNGFTIMPKVDLSLKFAPYLSDKAVNNEDVETKLNAKLVLSSKLSAGSEFEYKNKFIKTSISPSLNYEGILGFFNNKFYNSNTFGYKVETKLGVDINEKMDLNAKLSYEGKFKKNSNYTLKGTLNFNYIIF